MTVTFIRRNTQPLKDTAQTITSGPQSLEYANSMDVPGGLRAGIHVQILLAFFSCQ